MKLGTWGRIGFAAAVLAAAFGTLAAAGACHKKVEESPQVSTTGLPVQRVVLYRNGVGYFERAGQVKGDEVRFTVRKTQVADFLASLTVVTRDGKPVEFVSFPIEKEKKHKDETPPPVPGCWPGCPYPPQGMCPTDVAPEPATPDEEEEDEDTLDVVVRLQAGVPVHDVLISYVVESPIWRPTYRIVIDDQDGKALLQGWAVVQNTSGEDWKDVALTVTEGAPLTFRADLANPYIPLRPLVTDQGEVVQAAVASSVSVSEETRRQLAALETKVDTSTPMPDAMPYAPAAGESGGFGLGDVGQMGHAGGMAMGYGRSAGPMARSRGEPADRDNALSEQEQAAPPPPPQGLTAGGAQASLALLALGSQEGGITTYRSTGPVTVREDASTLVAIFNQQVDASDTLLFRPDAGVPASSSHPFRVVRFTNQAGVTLERGPVAIFGTESFLGQGMLQPLPNGATTSIPYALERGVSVSVEPGSSVEEARLVKVLHGVLTVRRYAVHKTKYVVQNMTGRTGKLFVQHTRMSGWELKSLPAGAEEVDAATVIVPIELPVQGKVELELIERSPMLENVALITDVGRDAVRLYLEGPAIDDAAGPALRRALELRDRIGVIDTDIARFSAERDEISQAMGETQNNLYAIEGINRAGQLRQRLTQRLTELEARYAEVQTKVIDLTAQRGELRVELDEALRDVTLEVPPEPAPAPPAPAPAAPPTP